MYSLCSQRFQQWDFLSFSFPCPPLLSSLVSREVIAKKANKIKKNLIVKYNKVFGERKRKKEMRNYIIF